MVRRDSMVGPLQTAVHRRLDELTRSITETEPEEAAEVGRRQLALLADALRSVLAEHEPDARGRCPACRGRLSRMLLRRRSRTPCRAYLAVLLRLDDGTGGGEQVPPVTRHHRRRKQNLRYAS
ncbi:hypothetical protein [Amycolatopsis nigrescens]|uniref:hypothetical protein n=1 Tax=Amycolatopsis nigrescens TaxID=381445 RepID=UPI0003AA52BA|nr:hypothetical protein [Amycolatopsis nigrescens]